MLKALTELEKAIDKILARTERSGKVPHAGRRRNLETGAADNVDNEEAAELIRRAIKRLKSL